jgi:chlorite dismutase
VSETNAAESASQFNAGARFETSATEAAGATGATEAASETHATGSTSETRATEPSGETNAARLRELNATVRYTMWSVFRAATPLGTALRDELSGEVDSLFAQLGEKDVVVRGTYDVSGLRADADLMVWWHASSAEALQDAYARLRRTRLGAHVAPVWSVSALHRPAEFNKSHVPAFLAGEAPGAWVNVYPFVRSYEWYLLPDEERREMLAEHGRMARGYPDVRANTVASFALNDYEWILAFEANELHRIVDLMRDLRASRARRHVREEVPFYTGRRRPVAEIVASLP